MPKRNIVWIVIAAVIAILLWKVPETIIRQDRLLNQFGPMVDIQFRILKSYVEPVDDQALLRGAIEGMLGQLDPYCKYYNQEEYEQFHKQTEGQYTGIGIEVAMTTDGELVVISPIEGSPAFQAEVLANDRIRKIDDKKTDGITLLKAVELITGKPGTEVALTIYRPSTKDTIIKKITRQLIEVRTVRGWARTEDWEWDYLIDPKYRIGYVRVSSFERLTTEQLDEVIEDLIPNKQIRALILDLRDNPGGLLPAVVDMANRFLSEGIIVSTKGRSTTVQPYLAIREHTYPADIPLAVLINGGSASASEIMAGALKDHNRAILVGEKTFGKGSVQEVYQIPGQDGSISRIKLTTAYYHLPKGERIHGHGVEPHKLVELTPEEHIELNKSRIAVYSTAKIPTTTRAATTTAPAAKRVEIIIDRQLQTALDALKEKLTTRASND